MTHSFIDIDGNTFIGEQAQELLKETNDSRFLTKDGIVKVDGARWKVAQEYERKTWMERNLSATEDRNREHFKRFDGYKTIAGMQFDQAIEIGCGPFTNLKYIIPFIYTNEIILSDPLIMEYKNLPSCSYKDHRLSGRIIYGMSWWPIEEDRKALQLHDLVVMINVLEHCQDAEKAFTNVYNILNMGGVFVFADVCFESNFIEDFVPTHYDAGHPLRLSREFVEEKLSHYKSMYVKWFFDLYGQPNREDIYYIGRKM